MLPSGLVISEGGRVRVPDGLAVDAPAGWILVDGWLRAPYGIEGATAVVVRYRCSNGEERVASFDITVSRLSFTALPAWVENTEGPSAREHPLFLVDGDRLLLYGGYAFRPRQFTLVKDLWSYDLRTNVWQSVTATDAPALGGARWARGPGPREVVLLGGGDPNFNAQLVAHRLPIDGDAIWSPVLFTKPIEAQTTQLGSLIYDAPRARFISACGITTDAPHCQVGVLDTTQQSYSVLTPAGAAPSGRYGFFFAHDEENQRLVVFSGAQASVAANPVNPAQDTWALELDEDPVRWTKLLDADPAAPGRRNGCAAFDPIGQRMFVWGGTPDARNTEQGLFAIDLLAGHERITRVDVPLAHATRSSCTGVYDPARKRILFGFGNNSTAIFADLVALQL